MKNLDRIVAGFLVCVGVVVIADGGVEAGKALAECNVEIPTMQKVTVRCFSTKKISGPNKLRVAAWAECRSTIDDSTFYVEDKSPAKATKLSSVRCPEDFVVLDAGAKPVK